MVTITPNTRHITYNPVSPETAFPVSFPIFDNRDVKLFRDDVEVTGFTVTGDYFDGVCENATIHINPGIFGKIDVVGLRTPQRTDQYLNGRPLSIKDHNYSLNRLTIESQEARRDIDPLINGLRAEILARINGDEALASLIGTVGSGNAPLFDTNLAVSLAIISPLVKAIRTAGYLYAGDGGDALYIRVVSEPIHAGKIQSADGAWWELVTDVANVRMFGAKGDGVSDDTLSMQLACGYAKAANVPVYYPAGVYLTSKSILLWSGCVHFGDNGQYGSNFMASIIKLKNGSNVNVFQGETTEENWDADWADWHDIGDNFWTIRDIVIDGNRENNTKGHGLFVWGRRFTMERITIRETAGNGLTTKFSDGSFPSGMESYFSNLIIDTTGGHGWDFMGPHDSVVSCMNVIDAGVNEHNVYSGLNITLGGNARFFAFHAWSRGNNQVRMRHALSMAPDAGVCDFSNSHFEGAYQANVLLGGGKFIGSDTCMYYAAWNGLNILVTTGGHIVKGLLGAPGAGRPASKGIALGYDMSQNIWGCRIDVFAESQGAGIIDFTGSSGGNMIDIIGFNDAGVLSVGSPHAGDTCRVKVSGQAGGRLFQDAT